MSKARQKTRRVAGQAIRDFHRSDVFLRYMSVYKTLENILSALNSDIGAEENPDRRSVLEKIREGLMGRERKS